MVKKAMFVPTHRHRTGGLYVYRMTAEHTGTSEKLVIYTSFEGHSWARPEKEFAERFTALTMNESAELSRPYG